MIGLNYDVEKKLWIDAKEERYRQTRKFGVQDHHSPAMWVLILGEEFGELAGAVMDEDGPETYKEAVQNAAVALSMARGVQMGQQNPETDPDVLGFVGLVSCLAGLAEAVLHSKFNNQGEIHHGLGNVDVELCRMRGALEGWLESRL